MKIYFAYRSGYIPNNRHVKVFEAASVLDWFVQNWPVLAEPSSTDEASDALQDLLGDHPYGLPVSDYNNETPIPAPGSLGELKQKLEKFTYNNEVLVAKDYVQVLTDDDEIELAWYVFDEDYARENAAKISIWQHPDLPLQIAEAPHPEPLKSKQVLPAGTRQGCVYWMSSTIHDGANLDDLEGAFRIEGTRLPDLLEYFRRGDALSTKSGAVYGPADIRFFQRLCNLFPDHRLQQLLAEWAKCPSVELDVIAGKDIAALTLEEVRRMQSRGASSNSSRIVCGEHLVEVVVGSSEFHDYFVLFDDLWLAANPDLARSLSRFCTTWNI